MLCAGALMMSVHICHIRNHLDFVKKSDAILTHFALRLLHLIQFKSRPIPGIHGIWVNHVHVSGVTPDAVSTMSCECDILGTDMLLT